MSQQSSKAPVLDITVEELAERLKDGIPENLQLVDVREDPEVEIASIKGFKVLSLSKFSEWSDQINVHLDNEKETLVLCHHGIRSAQMCQWLKSQGFTNVKNIVGGIDAYSIVVDRSIPRY
ncbi:rhodanese-like domain-containing protein [Okeania sp. KiyG1]|uniref:rhodanese-like domain-containing protein n=1 Tax=Okeania sp. KiyG1 TaxID=2720165 RepID=UPI001924BC65|nr:rhodanese-like domain-containing protein [Okeania sp. KiyG1]GGA12710.1 rhodanese-like domain-containing protein [Okeania sp. KiyG1]